MPVLHVGSAPTIQKKTAAPMETAVFHFSLADATSFAYPRLPPAMSTAATAVEAATAETAAMKAATAKAATMEPSAMEAATL